MMWLVSIWIWAMQFNDQHIDWLDKVSWAGGYDDNDLSTRCRSFTMFLRQKKNITWGNCQLKMNPSMQDSHCCRWTSLTVFFKVATLLPVWHYRFQSRREQPVTLKGGRGTWDTQPIQPKFCTEPLQRKIVNWKLVWCFFIFYFL